MTTSAAAPVSVRFARRSTRGLLLGFSTPRVIVLGSAVGVGVAALFFGGPTAFLAASLVWLPLAASAVVRIAGRPAVEWAATATHFAVRKTGTQTEFRAK